MSRPLRSSRQSMDQVNSALGILVLQLEPHIICCTIFPFKPTLCEGGRWALRTSSFTKENHSSKVMTIQANGEKSSIETSINLLKAMLALEAADNLIHILT